MTQLPLFRAEREPPPPRSPDTAFIRKSLNRVLRTLRDAEIMPWSDGETRSRERHFPELAALLPAEEAQAMNDEFHTELARLRACP